MTQRVQRGGLNLQPLSLYLVPCDVGPYEMRSEWWRSQICHMELEKHSLGYKEWGIISGLRTPRSSSQKT